MNVSIIVPVYNTEKYLNHCLISILNQSYTDFELILVNDGSKDNSGNICDEFAKNDSRIKVIHKENGGQSSARNRGLGFAQGKYIVFVDSDDVVDKDMIEVLLKTITETGAEIATCRLKKFADESEITSHHISQIIDIYDNDTIMKEMVNNNIINFSPCGKIYKKEIFSEFRFREGIIFEDMELLFRIWARTEKAAIIHDELYFYRTNPNSTLNSKYSERHLIEYDVRKQIYEFYRENYPQYSYNVYVNWMFCSVLMYVKITNNKPKEKAKYKYLLKFDRKILKKSTFKDLLSSVKIALILYMIAPQLLVLAFRIKY